MIKLLWILMSLLSLNACDYFQQDRTLDIKITASPTLNPDLNGRPSPALLSLYELKDKLPFKSLDFSKISYQSYQSLKSNLIDFSTLEIRPSENKQIQIKIHKNTQYLGLIAAYRELEDAIWRQIIEMPKNKNHVKIHIYLAPKKLNAKLQN